MPIAFPIVGVGASAGGLNAFTELLRALPEEPGLALVLMQHLQPGKPSLLPGLLQKWTELPVVEISRATVPQPNYIYVMPAGTSLTFEGGELRLKKRRIPPAEVYRPIDWFLQALAAERGSAAVGVVLSGTGSDGTEGLRAIKAAGGTGMAQTEGSAEYGGMPRSAVESGLVDFVLDPADLARELVRLAGRDGRAGRSGAEGAQAGADMARGRDYRAVLDLLNAHTGVDFSQYRASTIGRRLTRRMGLHGTASLGEYVGYLRSHEAEVSLLYEDLLMPATRFFRDPEVFEFLKKQVLAKLVQERGGGNRVLRLWSVGCSTGEEAYTLAMVGLEALGAHGSGGRLQVFGTDLNASALRRARAGRYPADIAKDISADRLERFFLKADHGYRVSKTLRDVCVFAQHNIARSAPFSHLDVVCCRNVMIYMEPVLQRRVFPILHYALNPGGTLVLGTAESATAAGKLFQPLGRGTAQRKLKLYRSQPGTATPFFELGERRGAGAAAVIPAPSARARDHYEDLRREADRIVLAQYAPAGVIVDASLEVLDFRGKVSRYLEPAPGAASLNITRMGRGNLGAYVRSAVARAQKTGAAVHQSHLSSSGASSGPASGDSSGGTGGEFDLHVVPLPPPDGAGAGPAHFLVLFQPVAADEDTRVRPAAGGKAPAAGAGREIERLQRRLAESQELIRALSEEYQDSKQEYQAATEEIASANEELQSSNEELETSKEELQSANEEISTVNEELRHRNTDLHQTNADLQNLISVANFAVVVLDREFRIRRFSPAAEQPFHLAAHDLGRRIGDIRAGVAANEIEGLALAAFASKNGQRRQLQDGAGRWHELQVNPYYNPDNQMDGVVLVLTDIDVQRRAAEEVASASVRAATNPLALLAHDGTVLRANRAFLERAGLPAEGARWSPPGLAETLGKRHGKGKDNKRSGDGDRFELKIEGQPVPARAYPVPGREGLLLVALD